MKKVKVSLMPIVSNINLPTVVKTAILPGDSIERLFYATQLGEIFYIENGHIRTFLDIRSRVLKLGDSSGYDERGLLGLAFHPEFHYNGKFYLHYSVAGSQGPGALPGSFEPDPCDLESLNLKWINRTTLYNHIDTVEEWILQSNCKPQKRRTLLNLRRPFLNHNGVNSLNFSPETGNLVLTTGDGGSGYDPFNLSQDNMEVLGKIIEIDVNNDNFMDNPPVVTRFNEIPVSIQGALTVMAKGVRNIPGISFQKHYDRYIKYVGNVGQDMVESIYSFIDYKPVPVTQLVQCPKELDQIGFVNFGWRGWEGNFPSLLMRDCPENSNIDEKIIAYYNDAVKSSTLRLPPLTTYYHEDNRPDKFEGTALTGVQPYMGNGIPDLTGLIVFIDLVKSEGLPPPARGVLAYTSPRTDCKLSDFSVIETDFDFGTKSAYYVTLGTNLSQSRLYLGVYGSTKVTDLNLGTIYEIIP